MTDVVEVAGGSVTVAASTSGVSVDDPDGGAVVVGPDGTTVTVDPAVDVVTAGGGTTVVATGTTAIQVVEAGGGGVSDHGALSGLDDDDHPQYLLADGSRAVDGDLIVTGVVPSYWTFTNSPRNYGGTDYYIAGDLSVYVAVQNLGGDWVDVTMFDDGTTTLLVYQWVSSWSGLYIHLCDGAGLGLSKFTVVSNLPWTTVDSHFAALFGPGLITADVADVTGWTYSDAPTYTWTDSTGLAVCAPSGATTWPDPATMTATILPKLNMDREGQTEISGNVAVAGDLYVTGNGTQFQGDAQFRETLQMEGGTAEFRPPLVESASQPTRTGLFLWHDTTLDEWWLIVNMSGSGNKKVQLV